MGIFRKLFISGDWNIAFRKKSEFFDYEEEFVPLPKMKNYWFADPMLYEHDDSIFLFCEAYNKKKEKGELAVFEYKNGNWINFNIIISENYHMSYPCIFEIDNKIFMIPETGENHTLQIYECVDFPTKWKLKKVLIENDIVADSTVFYMNNQCYFVTYKPVKNSYDLLIYKLNNDFEIELDNEIINEKNVVRPAGNLFMHADSFVLPTQKCSNFYGETVIFNDFNVLTKQLLPFKEINVSKIQIGKKTPSRIHTYGVCNSLEVIDYSIFRFDLLKRCKILRRRYVTLKRGREK